MGEARSQKIRPKAVKARNRIQLDPKRKFRAEKRT